MKANWDRIVKSIQFVAYLLAFWSFLVLFFEPVIEYYLDIQFVEISTACANLVLLVVSIMVFLLSSKKRRIPRIIIYDMLMLVLVMGLLLLFYQPKLVTFILLIRQTYFILSFLLIRLSDGKLWRWLSGNPPVALILSFAVVIFFGTVLLMLPISSSQNRVTPIIEALFTSTSATCVTGLAVLDTGSHFSMFGQIVILILIQIGGLGIMTISTFFALLLGRSIDLKLKNIMHNVVAGSATINLPQLLKNIVIVTALIEGLGALLLYTHFGQSHTPLRAAYLSVFHSVSAFCNAGFSPLSNGLVPYANNPMVNIVIGALIILGGLGFTVIVDIYRYVLHKDKVRKLSLHSKIVISTTCVLLLLGFVSYFIFEYHHSMKGFPLLTRIFSSLFQSITTRTAGFNTIGINLLSKPALIITMVLMFIGASPGSTGGGIKTTTLSVLLMSILSMFSKNRDLSMFKRRITMNNFMEATGLAMMSALILVVVIMALMAVEPASFEKTAFEAISAFGTVGLSMGITPYLTVIGKLLITMLMFVGRIGPLTMIYAFSLRRKRSNVIYAEENIAIG